MISITGLQITDRRNDAMVDLSFSKGDLCAVMSADSRFLDLMMRGIQAKPSVISVKGKSTPVIVYLPATSMLIDEMTVLENLALKTGQDKWFIPTKKQVEYEELFQQFGYTLPLNAQVGELSESQKRFAELFRAYLLHPDVIIASEMTRGLSYMDIICMNRILSALRKDNTTVLDLTPNWEEALKIANTFVIYSSWQYKKTLTRDEVMNYPQELYNQMYDIRMSSVSDEEKDTERNWARVINESMQIEDQRNRVREVIQAYCARCRDVLEGEFCRIYMYSHKTEQLTMIEQTEGIKSSYGEMKLGVITDIIRTTPLYFSNAIKSLYSDIFVSEDYPPGVFCCTWHSGDDMELFLQCGYDGAWVENSKIEKIRLLMMELSIFIENDLMRSQTLMLQESNHRVKNNMQMILNFITIQKISMSRKIENSDEKQLVTGAMDDLTNRVMAVYNVNNIISGYEVFSSTVSLDDIIKEISKIYGESLIIEADIYTTRLPKKVMLPMSIILNELINNSIKHNSGMEGGLRADICLKTDGKNAVLIYKDNGIGEDKNPRAGISSGIGMKLIGMIAANDLHGSVNVDTSNGYCLTITFPESVLAEI